MAELYIPRERPKYNPANGQFLKGTEPFNKGKKWDEYMGKRAQRRAMKGWKNLDIDLDNRAIEMLGHDEVIRRKIDRGYDLFEEDKKYIRCHI